ncbi:MAG: glycoside hydrolase family 15 protein [Phormidesmis sp.]
MTQAIDGAASTQPAESFDTQKTFLPISDYGLIGNCHTAALVSSRGSVDWLCLPRFDSPSLFARILDLDKGGSWEVSPAIAFTSTHRYLENTNILETTFSCATGKVTLLDFMDIVDDASQAKAAPGHLVRIVRGVEGTVEMTSRCTPRPNYGRDSPQFTTEGAKATAVSFGQFTISGPTAWQVNDTSLSCHFTISADKQVAFRLKAAADDNLPHSEPDKALLSTTRFWRDWAQQCTYEGPYRSAVVRSSLVLQLMTYVPTGALVAAPTTSLPERIGGDLNWDYRLSWIRDSSFTLYALLLAGFLDDEWPYFNWLAQTVKIEGTGLKILYAITSEGILKEQSLSHLSGYRNSPPVRIGNGASEQVQLDVYGEVLSAIHFAWRADDYDPTELWPRLQPMLNWVSEHWQEPGSGIWEIRGEKKHYVYSKAMMWVALDCGIEMAESLSLAGEVEQWKKSRDRLRSEILEKGWSEKLGAFKQAYESEALDASNLLLSAVGFIAGDDPKMISTIEATIQQLVSNDLCYRYKEHPSGDASGDSSGSTSGSSAAEGTFVLCTFWLINALIQAGRLEEADQWFEKMLAKGSPLGLFAEEMEPASGLHLGNFPQAFSHLGVVNVAVALAHAGHKGKVEERHVNAVEAVGRGRTKLPRGSSK